MFAIQANAVLIQASNELQIFDLQGDDGQDGKRGINCEDGKNGQSGYKGEEAIVFYNNNSELANIVLNQEGGTGGLGGERGTRNNCTSNQGYNHDGDDGRQGSYGDLILIKDVTELEKPIKRFSISIKNVNGEVFTFINHDWAKKSGAKRLFSSASNISDKYLQYISTVTTPYLITIDDSIDLNAILNYNLDISYSLTSQKRLELKINKGQYDDGLLLDYEITKVKSINNINITKVFTPSLIKNTKFLGVTGEGKEATLKFYDETLTDESIELTSVGTLYQYSRFIDRFVIVRDFSSTNMTVTKKGNIYQLKIGDKKSFAKLFKKGQKFKVKMSFYKKRGIGKTGYSKEITFQL
jgi:hypothetical protein